MDRVLVLTVIVLVSANLASAAKWSANPEKNLLAIFENQRPAGWSKLQDRKLVIETSKDHMGLPIVHVQEAPVSVANQEIYFRLGPSGRLEIVVLESSKDLLGPRPGLALMTGKTVFTRTHVVVETADAQPQKLSIRTRSLKIIEEKPVGRPHLLDFLARLKWSAETLVFGGNNSLAQTTSKSRSAVFYANNPARSTTSLPQTGKAAGAAVSQSAARLLSFDFWQRLPLPGAATTSLRNLLRQSIRL